MHPVLIALGPWHLSTYGAFVAAGYLAGILWLKTQMRVLGLDEKGFWRLVYCLFFGAVVGGKLMFWAVSYREILSGRLGLLSDLRYGFVFFGGLLGAMAMAWLARLWLGFSYATLADLCGVGLPLGHALGRLGCLGAGCCYGRPTRLPWGIALGGPESSTPVELWGVPLHPAQVYESLANIAIALFLGFFMLPRAKRRELVPGTVFWGYVLLYGAARFLIEFFRYDDRGASLPPFSISQWLSLAGIAAAAAALARRGARPR